MNTKRLLTSLTLLTLILGLLAACSKPPPPADISGFWTQDTGIGEMTWYFMTNGTLSRQLVMGHPDSRTRYTMDAEAGVYRFLRSKHWRTNSVLVECSLPGSVTHPILMRLTTDARGTEPRLVIIPFDGAPKPTDPHQVLTPK